jgi:dTDP-4-dehydrorhamnose reductase
MSIVVTGAYGQLGGELCRRLGANAIPLDIDTLDLTDGQAVADKLPALKPTAVINCAAYTQVDKAESEPEKCRAVNAGAVEHLVRVCGTLDCPLVQISTDYVFGAKPKRPRPWREDDPPAPQGVYAQTKLEGERIAARWPKHLIVRTCGLYARPCDQRAANFVKTMLRLGAARSELRVVDDQCCTPTYVPHLAQAILFLLGCGTGDSPHLCNDQRGASVPASGPFRRAPTEGWSGTVPFSASQTATAPWGTYHVTNTGQATWREFAVEIFRLAGMKVAVRPITTAEYGAAAPRPSYSVLDTSAYQRLGGPAMPDWRAALADYFAEGEAPCPTQKSP